MKTGVQIMKSMFGTTSIINNL